MKNLFNKLVLPLSVTSLLSLCSPVKSQDFLPGKFKNYQDKKVMVDYVCLIFDENRFLDVFRYDIDNDSIIDVVEISLVKFENDSLKSSDYPIAYALLFDEGKRPKFFYDPKMNGWTGDEEILPEENIDHSKFNL